jgi:hypothetical protein
VRSFAWPVLVSLRCVRGSIGDIRRDLGIMLAANAGHNGLGSFVCARPIRAARNTPPRLIVLMGHARGQMALGENG